MKSIKLAVAVFFTLLMPALSAEDSPLSEFVGAWTVDLRPTPDADAYLQPFIVRLEDDGTFSGEFYNTPFTEGRYNDAFGELHFAFITSDASTEYYHSGKLVDGMLEGLTHAPNRQLLQYWTAIRAQ